MSVLHFRKDPLEDDIIRESHTPGIHFPERRCSSLKLCSHAADARSGRHQLTCKINHSDDRSSPAWRFLLWVAYDRNLAGSNQITDDERLRCPILWCRRRCDDQNKLLEHVFRCAHCSDGWYWCFHCQKEESFTSCQCKHCQAPAFGKERLSVRVKRLLRSLGTKSHQKDHEALDPSAAGASGISNRQCSEYLPQYGEILAVEMDSNKGSNIKGANNKGANNKGANNKGSNNKGIRELEADCVPGPAELNGFTSLPAELDSESAMTLTFKQDVPRSRSESITYTAYNEAASFASQYASMEAVQALSLPSSDIREGPSQFSMDGTYRLAIPEDSLPQLQSPVSPQNADWIPTSYTDAISESPTDTDFSDISLFTKSFESDISPPSTRNSTMQSFSQSSATVENPSDYQSTLSTMHDLANEMPNDIEEFSSQGQANGILADAVQSTERQSSTRLGSRNWLTPNDLLSDFWKVLTIQVVESSERLKMHLDSHAINELLSMTAGTIAYTGFEAWRKTLKGYLPTTIAHLYSLVHVACACAIVIYDGQVENQLKSLFTQSLSIGTGTLSEDDKWIYTSIAWSIWSPSEDIDLHPLASTESTAQLVQPPSWQSYAKGNAPLRLIGVSERMAQFLSAKEVMSTGMLHSNRENEILNVLNHFLDIFEGTPFCSEVPSVVGNQSYAFRDENFIRTIKENVTNPLIEGRFQPGPSLEAFIKVVLKIDTLVSIGQITTVREVEAGLKWAGRSIAQSIKLYDIFSNRVKDLCSAVSCKLRSDPALQNESHIEGINAMWINLEMVISDAKQLNSDEEHWRQSGIGPGTSSFPLEHESSPLGNIVDNSAVDRLSQSNIMQAGLCRRSAIKRKRPSSSSSSSTPETGPSPSSSASSNTLFESSESGNICCSSCGFRPNGAPKWYKRTMERHIHARHGPGHKKVHVCDYEGCRSSFTRADNLTGHVRRIHLSTKRQCNSGVGLGTGDV